MHAPGMRSNFSFGCFAVSMLISGSMSGLILLCVELLIFRRSEIASMVGKVFKLGFEEISEIWLFVDGVLMGNGQLVVCVHIGLGLVLFVDQIVWVVCLYR
jgi:hypothetical protein